MLYEQLLDQVISDGIVAARADYAGEPDKLKGAVDGFESCRGKSPAELVTLWQKAERDAHDAALREAHDYWRWRCRVLEIEWVCNVISVGCWQKQLPPLLPHLPTARAAMKYAEIVGVRGGEGAS